ncbi:MAG TPA: endolytic transglycosylase MltG [Nocardioidaceae bacterium]|nr:endolytic transglycosylase MltG [Nocardioidaceae bacterium]
MNQEYSGDDLPAEDHHPIFGSGGAGPRSRRAPKKRRGVGCLVALALVAMLAGAGALLVSVGSDKLGELFASAEDFDGPGKGQVVIEVKEGDSSAAIGRTLKAEGVVASVDAFLEAASADERARGIQVGFYQLKKEMSAADALAVLVDPANLIRARVTIPEGLTVSQIIDILGKQTEFKAAQYRKILENPGKLGLPAYAGGNPEGYLFPATYDLRPDATALSVLQSMVKRWTDAAAEVDLEGAAQRLGYTPAELVTIASLVEAEARGDDMPKVARVIYNRLETPGAPTFGKLEIDATVNYALGRDDLGVALSSEDLQVDSPYNTRRFPGLPPGPIEAAGLDALRAAVEPAEGDWYFYVTVNLATGETKFAETYDEFLGYKAEFQRYCQTSDAC